MTERIIAVRFPGGADERRFRGHLRDVAALLRARHRDGYTVRGGGPCGGRAQNGASAGWEVGVDVGAPGVGTGWGRDVGSSGTGMGTWGQSGDGTWGGRGDKAGGCGDRRWGIRWGSTWGPWGVPVWGAVGLRRSRV